MFTRASRASMRGTSRPSGTRVGFRAMRILGYTDQMAGDRANSSECLACMRQGSFLWRQSIDDDLEAFVLADMIANLPEGVAAHADRRAAERHARNHFESLTHGDPALG